MSKIEKALRKAQSNRELSNSKALVNTKSDSSDESSKNAMTIKRAASSALIKNMGEDDFLSLDDLVQRRIIFPEMSDGNVANSYRVLRTKLLQKSKGENFIVMITSCTRGYDSSYITLNLSAAFSLDEGKTSLVVDCNLHEPRIDKMLGISAENGLTDYLEHEDVTVDKIIQPAGIKRLRVIAAGEFEEKTSEYFTSKKMKNLLDSLVDRYPDRYVFLDAPSIIDSADAKILSELSDFVIVAVPYGKATKNQVMASVKAIDADKLLGVVMNDLP